ncbi:HNH endonuclease [Halosegnis marinus]|uniref:HNH endonuclease n=1 Tax=Halosegnis marinus TaxID=3034023 RepID=A0ABD5ZT14_9EURY|nr:HNH endonuclease [Halosegnis sp. DT85]
MSDGYPSDWDTRRKDVYQRDDYTCQNCGARGGPQGNAELHAHHIVPKSNGGTHKRSNLKTMCSECHKAIHGDVMAPAPDDVLPSNTDSIRITNAQELVNLVSETINLYKELRSHPVISGNGVTIEGSVDDDWIEEITRKRTILSEYTTLSYDSPRRQDAVDTLQQATAQHLYLMTDVVACISDFYDVAQGLACPDCGSDASVDADFCGDCGASLPTVWECPDCGRGLNTFHNDFCTYCGSELDTMPSEKAEDFDTTIKNIEAAIDQADAKSEEISTAFDQFRQVF